jgi:hypothetical protein
MLQPIPELQIFMQQLCLMDLILLILVKQEEGQPIKIENNKIDGSSF